MKRLMVLVIYQLILSSAFAQNEEADVKPKLILDLPVLDFPYMKHGIQAQANYREGSTSQNATDVQARDFSAILGAPSMYQIMGYSSTYYNSMNYGIARVMNHWIDPSKGKSSRIWNRVAKEFTAAVAFAATTKLPFAGGWAHEEFHRNTWGQYDIGSYDEIWDWNLSPDALSYVSHLRDDDLSWFKAHDPAGFVRMGSSGIEAHYLMNETLQTQDFLYDTNLPNLAIYLADVLAAADYVNRASTTKTIDEHSHVYDPEQDELKRDFIGNDFTGWVYDLFRPYELYADRGVHPTGIGIDRYRTYEDLTPEMLDYMEQMGSRQWLNLVSPFMIGIRQLRINPNLRANFALRHYLTSFGDDLQLEVFTGFNQQNMQFVLHRYHNHENTFVGVEARSFDHVLRLGSFDKISMTNRLMIYQQPEDQMFETDESVWGGLVSTKFNWNNESRWTTYLQLEAKTAGWVAGNPYLDSNVSARFGLSAKF
jgi:hypothetical protein